MRLFIAVQPPGPVVDLIAGLERPPRPGVRWTGPGQWHVTLRFLGSVDPADLGAVTAAVDSVTVAEPVTVTLGPATACFGRHVLQVPASGLAGLATAVVAATAALGEPPDRRPFAGHLTLARSRPRGPDLRPLAGAPLAASWVAAELTVVRSHLDAAGARHEVLHRRPLPSS